MIDFTLAGNWIFPLLYRHASKPTFEVALLFGVGYPRHNQIQSLFYFAMLVSYPQCLCLLSRSGSL